LCLSISLSLPPSPINCQCLKLLSVSYIIIIHFSLSPSPHVSAVSWVSCVHTLEGSVGGAVDITCKYPNGIEAETVLLMKINFSNNVIIIESKQREKTEGRFSL